VADQSDRIRARKLELVEASGMSAQDIRADALARRYEIVYVDYMQLIEPETRKANRTEQVSGISRSLQQLAHGTGRLVVALSQLSRAEHTGKNEQVEPTMSDLRESGQIEQDADAILLLYLEEPNRPEASRRVLKVAKNKEGTRGRIYLVFDGQYQRFRESALEEPAPAAKRQTYKRPPKAQMDFFDLPDEPVPFEEKTEELP
jgi:replicative DNA helicase